MDKWLGLSGADESETSDVGDMGDVETRPMSGGRPSSMERRFVHVPDPRQPLKLRFKMPKSVNEVTDQRPTKEIECAALDKWVPGRPKSLDDDDHEAPYKLLMENALRVPGGGRRNVVEEEDEQQFPPDMDDSGMDAAYMFAPPVRKTIKVLAAAPDVTDIRQLQKSNDVTQIVSHARELIRRWILPPGDVIDDEERSRRLCANFKVDTKDLQPEMLEHAFEMLVVDINTHQLEIRLRKDQIGVENADELETDLYKVLKVCQATHNCLSSMLQQKVETMGASKPGIAYLLPDKSASTLTPMQQFTVELYKLTSARGYRLCNGKIYAPVRTKTGRSTHAYEPLMELTQFVSGLCGRSLNYGNWGFATGDRKGTSGVISNIVSTLETIKDFELPELVRDRHKFSFSNGVLLTRLERNSGLSLTAPRVQGSEFYCRFIPYDHPDFQLINDDIASANNFKQPMPNFPENMDWYDIPSPVLQMIIEYQYGGRPDSEEIYRELYADIGRMLFTPGDLENWQYFIFFKGIGGTGKSTILEYILKLFYLRENVAEINNNIEPLFGLGGLLYNRTIFLTTMGEIGENFGLELPTLLTMISGEQITAAVKNVKSALTKERYPSHIAGASNTQPNCWQDTAGQVTRRIKGYPFMKKVRRRDILPDLKDRLKDELANLMLKCARAYLEKANRYGHRNMWDVCPKFFRESSEAMKKTTNYLQSFMTDPAWIVVDDTKMVSETDLINEFKAFAKERNVSSKLTTKEVSFQTIIQDINDEMDTNIEYKKISNQLYEGNMVYSGWFFVGLGLTSKMTDAQRKRHFERTEAAEAERAAEMAAAAVPSDDSDEEYRDDSDYDDVFGDPPPPPPKHWNREVLNPKLQSISTKK